MPPKNPRHFYYESAGWIGLGLLAITYILYGIGELSGVSVKFYVMNLFGAIGIATLSFYKKAWQPGLLHAAWAAIALYSLYVVFATPAV